MSSTSHLTYVEKLPDDCIKIDGYLDHRFENLHYSPSNDKFYQAPRIKYREIQSGKSSFNCRSDNDRTIRVSIKKLKKSLNLN